MRHVPEPTRQAPTRPDTPDVLELKALKARQPELADAAEGRLKAPLRVLEQALQRQHAQGQAHLGADRFTVTDVCVASVVNWVRPAESLMQAYPAVSEWLHQCVNRTAHHSARKLGR